MVQSGVPEAEGLVALEALGDDRFRTEFYHDNTTGSLFGGQALGQALEAAQRTVPEWRAHSLQGSFLRAGRIDCPTEFQVERVFDSRRFSNRRVRAYQGGQPIFDLQCSFHAGEEGLQHQLTEMGASPDPESLLNIQELAASGKTLLSARQAELFNKLTLIELRLIDPENSLKQRTTAQRDYWFRIPTASGITDSRQHTSLLALMSDYWFPGTISVAHPQNVLRSVVSLNHSMWFHAPVRVDEWLLYRTESHWAGQGRGLVQGRIFNRDGCLVASCSQEALLREIAGTR